MDLRTFGINSSVNYEEVIYDNSIINKVYMISNPVNNLIKGIPDGCIDMQIVEREGKTEVYLAGSHLQGSDAYVMNYGKVFGIKFQAGTEFESLEKKKFSLDELIGTRCDITDSFDMSRLIYKFENQGGFKELVDCFWSEYSKENFQNRNYMVSFLVSQVEKEKGNLNITDLVEKTGYSQRYVNRVCKDKMGFSIKKYASIIRMQYALDVVREKSGEKLYDMLGYYDQAHFIHDFKNFTSVTPKKYQKLGEQLYFV